MASLAVSSPQRKVTEGYFKVPNSFVENQHLLKAPASRALALIIFRAESEPNGIRTLSDRRWEAWTGFKDRQKEYAIKELREFGLDVTGRGDTAKFSWDWSRWNQAVRTPNPEHKSPNYQSKARMAKPGANVHEDCHEHGCARLRWNVLYKPVQMSEVPLLVPAIAQCTAQTVAIATEKIWAATMAMLCSFFPLVGALFLARLVEIVRGHFPDITDGELAEAVRVAYHPSQRTEGLFLWRVPPAISAIRKKKRAEELSRQSAPGRITPEDIKAARDIIRAVESDDEDRLPAGQRWTEQDIDWAREILRANPPS